MSTNISQNTWEHLISQIEWNAQLPYLKINISQLSGEILATIHNGGIYREPVSKILCLPKPNLLDTKQKKGFSWSFLQKELGTKMNREQDVRYNAVQLPQGHRTTEVTFYHVVPRNSWYSYDRPRKDERLNRPWSHLMVLNLFLTWNEALIQVSRIARVLFPFFRSNLSQRFLKKVFLKTSQISLESTCVGVAF